MKIHLHYYAVKALLRKGISKMKGLQALAVGPSLDSIQEVYGLYKHFRNAQRYTTEA